MQQFSDLCLKSTSPCEYILVILHREHRMLWSCMSYTTPPAIICGEVELEVEMCSKGIECQILLCRTVSSLLKWFAQVAVCCAGRKLVELERCWKFLLINTGQCSVYQTSATTVGLFVVSENRPFRVEYSSSPGGTTVFSDDLLQ